MHLACWTGGTTAVGRGVGLVSYVGGLDVLGSVWLR